MITIIRHSERLDHVNKKKWEKSKRFKQNSLDTPITKKGDKIAINAINKILKKGYKNITYLYSSPLTRCIQTSLIIKKVIKKKLNIDLKIRIEYGLVEIEVPFTKFEKDKFVVDSNINYIDKELSINNLIKKYGNHFDKNYKSIIKYDKINFDKSFVSGYNRIMKIFKKINEYVKNNNTIICTHGGCLLGIYSYLNKKLNELEYNKVAGAYCSMILKEDNKVTLLKPDIL